MYGVGNGMFEARLRHQASGTVSTTEQAYLSLLSAACVTLNSWRGMRGCTSMVTFAPIFLKCWHDSLI